MLMEKTNVVPVIVCPLSNYCHHLHKKLSSFQTGTSMVLSSIKTCKQADPIEEFPIDLDASIKENELTLGSLNQIKQAILDNSNIIFDSLCSSLSQFTFELTFLYPKLIHWVVQNYAPSTRQIISSDGTKVIATINREALRKDLCLPSPNPNIVQFSEENNLAIVKALNPNQLYTFMSQMFQLDIIPSNFSFPYDISLFNETLQVVFSLLSQILGLENDKSVTEVMVGTIYLVSQYVKEFNLRFDQYLVERISYQLEHFHSDGKTSSYKTLLMLMVITENLAELRQIESVNFSEGTNLSQRNATISFFTFARLVMPAIYKVIFGSFMAKISEDLKLLL